MVFPYQPRDRSFKFPVTLDARKSEASPIWNEACRKEREFLLRFKSPAEFAAQRGGSDLKQIQQQRERLQQVSADYLWSVESTGEPASAPAAGNPPAAATSAMAHLAMGVPDFETAFLRGAPTRGPPRRARAELQPTVMPWQLAKADPIFVPIDALDRWKSEANVLTMPPAPQIPPRVPATISGPHNASVGAWRRSEVPLSQWEISERGENLVATNKLAEQVAHRNARAQLKKLLATTEHASRGKARWQDR
jgi:hypothetical protein